MVRLDELDGLVVQQLVDSGRLKPIERPKAKSRQALREDEFDFQARAYKLPTYERQHRFAKSIGRQWRFDFAFEAFHLAVEIEGLVVKQLYERVQGKMVPRQVVMGRHATIGGMKEDMEKYNTAAVLGWVVLRFEQTMVRNGTAIATTQRVLAVRGWTP